MVSKTTPLIVVLMLSALKAVGGGRNVLPRLMSYQAENEIL
jgi:hypothetical protein